MVAIVSVLVILSLSTLVTRVAAVALTHTGLSRESAAFQARSAFTGVGFTTGESESAVNHPVRRRIVALLMLLGNVGIVTGISSLILGFVNIQEGETGAGARIGILAAGAFVLVLMARSAALDRALSRVIRWAMDRWTHLDVWDYEALLHLSGDHRVRQLRVEAGDWLADHTLAELGLREEGVTVLGVEKADGYYVGAPGGDTDVEAGDVLTVYGRLEGLRELDERRKGSAGDTAHAEAVVEQAAVEREQRSRQAARRRERAQEAADD